MIELIPLQRHHLRLIRPQAAQLSEVDERSLAAPTGTAWTATEMPSAMATPTDAQAWGLMN